MQRLEREGKVSHRALMVRLYEISMGSHEENPDRLQAARLFLDRMIGPTTRAVRIEHEGVDPVIQILREIAAADAGKQAERKRLAEGAVTVGLVEPEE